MTSYPTSFISYSWEDDENKKWVKDLASRLSAKAWLIGHISPDGYNLHT